MTFVLLNIHHNSSPPSPEIAILNNLRFLWKLIVLGLLMGQNMVDPNSLVNLEFLMLMNL